MLNQYSKYSIVTSQSRFDSISGGFSLIELIVILAIIATISAGLIVNFRATSSNAIARRQATQLFLADLRRAQSSALSGISHKGTFVCGYGIHYSETISYITYAKIPQGGISCRASTDSRNYDSTKDLTVGVHQFINSNMIFEQPFSDIYFEIPEPITYLNNSTNSTDSVQITIKPVSAEGKTIVTVYQSGKIDTVEQ